MDSTEAAGVPYHLGPIAIGMGLGITFTAATPRAVTFGDPGQFRSGRRAGARSGVTAHNMRGGSTAGAVIGDDEAASCQIVGISGSDLLSLTVASQQPR